MTNLWTLVAAERAALADDIAALTPEQWASLSLCPDWTVRDIVAHLAAAASTSPGAFFGQFAKAGFSFDKYANTGLARRLGADTGATLAGFRAVQSSKTCRPGPKLTWLGEVVVHADDIRRSLGIVHSYDPGSCPPCCGLLQGLQHPHRRQEPDRRPRPEGDRRGLVPRRRRRCRGAAPVARHGDDGAQGARRGPDR